jgi:hypothetical protein
MATRPAHPSFRLRLLSALVLALVALGAPMAVPTAAAASTGVTWKIDDSAKTITAEIKITLTPVCSTNTRMMEAITGARLCEVPQTAADDIKKAIEKVWNKDNKYYCYNIVVKVDVTIDNRPSSDPSDSLRVQVDQSPVPVRSFVYGTRSTSATSGGTGSSANDQLNARNNGTGSSTWGYPPRSAQTYAHEAGHVLGLDDGYEDVRDANGNVTGSQIRPGHADDLMSNNTQRSHVDKSTLRRMVERQGYRKTQLKCNYKIDQPSLGGRITGLQCDPPGGLWTANGIYQYAGAVGDQSWVMTIDWNTKRGNFTYADNQTADFGVSGIEVRTEGEAAGDATITLDDELNARIHLVEKAHSFRATIPGLPGGHGKDQNAPLQSIDLVWEPIGKCPPP